MIAQNKKFGIEPNPPFFQHYICFSMNYLAHSFLSFTLEPVLFGQFIADDVKGRKWEQFPRDVQAGILLHRFIDDYTDQYPMILELKTQLHPTLGKFAGVVLDVLFDHVLSLRWNAHSNTERELWIQSTYEQLTLRKNQMTERRQFIAGKMIEYDWMNMYRTAEGTDTILNQMSKRIPLKNPLNNSFETFVRHEKLIISTFDEFFPQMLSQAQLKLNTFAP
jgi:acyl carrier protein phosphodiesterase